MDTVEASNALMAEVETTLEFVNDGGAYLPGMDDNFLADRILTVLIVRSSPTGFFFDLALTEGRCTWFTLIETAKWTRFGFTGTKVLS